MRRPRLNRGLPPRNARGASRRRPPSGRRLRRTHVWASPRSSISAEEGGESAPGSSHHPPIGAEEFDKRELLRLEKETLGTFLSSHPLADVKDALRSKVDCSLSQLESKADGSIVTVGGIVTELKRIKTKRGDPMMFATLDDVEGQVEMLVLGKVYAEKGDSVKVDSVLVVRGRLDHKERGQTKLLVQELDTFEPSDDELARARAARSPGSLVLRIHAGDFGVSLVEELKSVFESFPGDSEVLLEMETRDGMRRLKFGHEYRVTPSAALDAELDVVLGSGARAA